MFIVDPRQRGLIEEVRLHHFLTEASDIGLSPGAVPTYILIEGLGNMLPFVYESGKLVHGETVAHLYRQAAGCLTLEVIND